jgi:hypothetical protein
MKGVTMTYKSLGWNMTTPCTPPGRTFGDNRSCRERTGCTRECQPKTLKCEWCESMNTSLNVLEEIETGEHICVCNECKETIRKDINYKI